MEREKRIKINKQMNKENNSDVKHEVTSSASRALVPTLLGTWVGPWVRFRALLSFSFFSRILSFSFRALLSSIRRILDFNSESRREKERNHAWIKERKRESC